MEFQRTVMKRRMVRNFQSNPVSVEDVRRILQLAQHAPSAGYSQGVEFVVVQDSETKKKIGGEAKMFPGGFHNFVTYAPLLIVVCVSEAIYHRRYHEPDKIREDGTEIEWPTPYWFFDAGAASMIILLAAVDLGYAAVFSGIPALQISGVKKLLRIPEEYHPVGIISVGKPAPDKKSPSLKRGRRKFDDIVHFEAW